MALTSSSVINGENLTRKYQDDDDEGKNIGAELQKVRDLRDICLCISRDYMSVHIQAKYKSV